MATEKIKANTVKYGTLGTSYISTTSGSIESGSEVRYCCDNNFISINYMIRIKGSSGRPVVTITGLPDLGGGFVRQGSPTQVRIGSANAISDLTSIDAGNTQATIRMYNYLGDVPSGNGYLVYNGSVVAPNNLQ